ncbi:Wzz/FepE/Etk N-terminal domain-containing protein [Streptomyces sp. SLBN-31]|uniref:Wzz/FepE/Etk N-terminal domain-containing protein n=1 Tax=Streptomyces sp. SLBN-31 TaxID=2768444 RepID=UPI00114E66D0|nr:Wzz/FepE/Etk N-terminal domain-containing protein [Streptomyces sp. SLBN-31]TQJ91675.1 capsular polysaccharide biosynthesis protein [Streptomyces sp. SLBN-31]
MDLAEIFRVLRRRWYVLLPGLLLTAALIVGVVVLVPVSYQSQSTVVLLNSQKATVAYDGNPFLSTQTSLTGMADSLARNLNSDDSLRDLKARGATGTFEAKLADNAQGPLLWLTVTGTDKAAVLSSDKILTAYAEERLDQFQKQQSVAPKAMIRMTTIVSPQNPVAQTKTRLEYLIMAGAVGLVVTLVAAFYMEARKRPRAPEPQAPPEGPRQPGATAAASPAAEEPVAEEPFVREGAVEETLAIRRPPSWSRSAGDGRASAETDAPRPAMAVASAAEPLDEESTHGHRPRTGQRDR